MVAREKSLCVSASVLTAVVLALAGCADMTPPAKPETFRVMTYNIHHGEGLDGKLDVERIAEVIRGERADMVALQEVDKGVARTQRRDLPAELAALTGMTCVFSNNFHYQGGEYGNAVLTRFPILQVTNLHYTMLRAGEQRGLLQLTLNVNGRPLVFMNTHIDYRADDSERMKNLEQIAEVLKRYGGKPVILCGDFNDTPGSRVHSSMRAQMDDTWSLRGDGDGFSYPAELPRKRIDYIWISKDSELSPARVWVPKSKASDHLPVVAEIEILKPVQPKKNSQAPQR